MDHETILSYAREEHREYDAEGIIRAAMRLILEAIAHAVEKEEPEIAGKLREWRITVRPGKGSRFNIPPLDDPRRAERMDVEELVREVVEDVREAG